MAEGGWFTCNVLRAGPADDGKIYVALSDRAGKFNCWFYAKDEIKHEILSTALAVLSSGRSLPVEVALSSTDQYSQINRFYINPGATGLFVDPSGNVGIGTVNPHARLDVAGDIRVTGDVKLVGGDCAEDFDVSEEERIEPGTVLVIGDNGELQPSREPFDKRVAGVVSGGKDYRPGIILDRKPSEKMRLPIALTGKTYCKVDAHESPIKIGDLLTTSSIEGHAMKANDPLRAFGAVIGKALASLQEGTGLIPILVALQ